MADPVAKIIGRYARRIFIWPIEAGLVFLLFFTARLLPVTIASAGLGYFLGFIGPFTPWGERANKSQKIA